jgi:hypothetical protein
MIKWGYGELDPDLFLCPFLLEKEKCKLAKRKTFELYTYFLFEKNWREP